MNEIGKEGKAFQIVLDEKDFHREGDLNPRYIVACDPYEVEKPANLYQRLRKFVGLKYKTECVGYEMVVYMDRDGVKTLLNSRKEN